MLDKVADHFLGNHQISEKQNSSIKELAAATSGVVNKNNVVDFSNDVFETHNTGPSVVSKRNEACDGKSSKKNVGFAVPFSGCGYHNSLSCVCSCNFLILFSS